MSYGVQRSLFRSQIMKTLHFFHANSRHISNVLDVNLGSNNGNFFALRGTHLVAVKERKERLPRRGKTKGGFEEEDEEKDGIYNFPDPRPFSSSVSRFE